MSDVAVTAPVGLYHSPLGLYDFQADGVANCYLRSDNIAIWDAGVGKSHLAMALCCLLFEDKLVDIVFILCEQNKLDEWKEDFSKFTDLKVALYYGTPAKRTKIRAALGDQQVLISTYETVRNDAATKTTAQTKRGRSVKRLSSGPLLEALEGVRVLFVHDEVTKLGGRDSDNHKAHKQMIDTLRMTPHPPRLLGLTATPVERDPTTFYNLGRIYCPDNVGTVAFFEETYVVSKNLFGIPIRFQNLEDLAQRMSGVTLRKRKSDPDVRDQFPHQVEEFVHLPLDGRHQEFYETVQEVFADADPMTERSLFTVYRQIASHPMALMRSRSEVAQTIVREVGEAGLRALGSAKTDRMVSWLRPLVKGQGAQVVIFTFFGQSVLPLLEERLLAEDYQVAVHHGGLSPAAKELAKNRFRSGEVEVLLTSDAGARGINLPEALYLLQYELPLTYSLYIQRMNRNNRIDSLHDSVTSTSFIVLDTVEEGIADLVMRRNQWSDILLSDSMAPDDSDEADSFMDAATRKKLMEIGRKGR